MGNPPPQAASPPQAQSNPPSPPPQSSTPKTIRPAANTLDKYCLPAYSYLC